MDEIERKLQELANLLGTIPPECRGEGLEASRNRHRFLRVKLTIDNLLREAR